MLFKSERCAYREFGTDAEGMAFAEKFPKLADDIREHGVNYLMSKEYEGRDQLASAIRRMPEYLCFLKTTCRKDFFFAAFDQTAIVRGGEPGAKKTGQKDVEKFILERLKNQLSEPRTDFEFVVQVGPKVIGYVELFDRKTYDGGVQCERGLFISPDEQANGYGKEAILAVTDYAFKVLGMDRIFTMADPNNFRSVNNIVNNSGGLKMGETESKYAHLDGGGQKRYLFHIYPENFYAAVAEKGNQSYMMTPLPEAPKPAAEGANLTPAIRRAPPPRPQA